MNSLVDAGAMAAPLKKNILIPVYDGTITKNLLRTGFLRHLKRDPSVRVILLPPHGKIELYEKEFSDGEKVVIDTTPIWRHDWVEFLFAELFIHSIPTNFMRIRQVDWYWNKKKYALYVFTSCLRVLGHTKAWRRILRGVNYLEPIPHEVREVYERWKPDLVFAPTMIPRAENALMKLARRDNSIVVGMAKSFDNLTSKAFLRLHPDRLIVPNALGVEEAATLYDYPKEHVVVTGIPQYDEYRNPSLIDARDVFCKQTGLDPTKRIILYAPAGDWMNPHDHEVLSMILSWIDDGTLPNTQVLLRLHPAYESKTETCDGHPALVVERPGKHFGGLKTYEFDADDVRHLANSLKHANVVIHTGSTFMMEAAIFDTPVISLAFDGFQEKPYWQSVRRYYDREHLVPIVRAGGSKIPTSAAELKDAILDYFAYPEHDREGRKKVVASVCGDIDGKAGERTAEVLLSMLREETRLLR